MKIIELLLEYDANKIKQLDSALSARERDDSAPKATSAVQLADYLDSQLNVKSGELVFWILHRYLKKTSNNEYGIKRWEDISSRLLPAIEKYTKLKNKNKITGNQRDINQFKSLSQLEDLLDQFPDEELASQREQANAIEQQFYSSGQAELIYNDSTIKMIQQSIQGLKAPGFPRREVRDFIPQSTNIEEAMETGREPYVSGQYIALLGEKLGVLAQERWGINYRQQHEFLSDYNN